MLSALLDACLLRWIPGCSAGFLAAPLEACLLRLKPVCCSVCLSFLQDAVCPFGDWKSPAYAFLLCRMLSDLLDACLLRWIPVCSA